MVNFGEMELVCDGDEGNTENEKDADNYDRYIGELEIPCHASYYISIYLNDFSQKPILTLNRKGETAVVCQ
ncbi:hypothetical protein KKB18_12610 [bacterium]|nr:hypothetical protein [bacterium]